MINKSFCSDDAFLDDALKLIEVGTNCVSFVDKLLSNRSYLPDNLFIAIPFYSDDRTIISYVTKNIRQCELDAVMKNNLSALYFWKNIDILTENNFIIYSETITDLLFADKKLNPIDSFSNNDYEFSDRYIFLLNYYKSVDVSVFIKVFNYLSERGVFLDNDDISYKFIYVPSVLKHFKIKLTWRQKFNIIEQRIKRNDDFFFCEKNGVVKHKKNLKESPTLLIVFYFYLFGLSTSIAAIIFLTDKTIPLLLLIMLIAFIPSIIIALKDKIRIIFYMTSSFSKDLVF